MLAPETKLTRKIAKCILMPYPFVETTVEANFPVTVTPLQLRYFEIYGQSNVYFSHQILCQ